MGMWVFHYIHHLIVMKIEMFKKRTTHPIHMEQKLSSKLNGFGLNMYESKLWVALLSRGESTAGELSDIANVPRSRSYDVLESLRKKGFVFVKQNKPMKYKAVSPEEVIKNTKEKVEERAKRQIKLVEDLKTKELFKELERIHKQSQYTGEQNEFVGVFKEKNNIKNQIQYMTKNTKKSIYINETADSIKSNMEFFIKTLPVLQKKGVDVKLMVSGDGDLRELTKKVKIKRAKSLNRFYVADDKEMLFMLFAEYEGGVLTNTKTFIKSITGLFDKQWDNSIFID